MEQNNFQVKQMTNSSSTNTTNGTKINSNWSRWSTGYNMYYLNQMISKTFRKNTTNWTKVVLLEADDQKDVDKYSRQNKRCKSWRRWSTSRLDSVTLNGVLVKTGLKDVEVYSKRDGRATLVRHRRIIKHDTYLFLRLSSPWKSDCWLRTLLSSS